MKRYLVFYGRWDSPRGGMNDFKKDFGSYTYAREYIEKHCKEIDHNNWFYQIYDTLTKELFEAENVFN